VSVFTCLTYLNASSFSDHYFYSNIAYQFIYYTTANATILSIDEIITVYNKFVYNHLICQTICTCDCIVYNFEKYFFISL